MIARLVDEATPPDLRADDDASGAAKSKAA
jgi:hypothetical protein